MTSNAYSLQMVSSSHVFPLKFCTNFSSPPAEAGGDEKCATAYVVQHFFSHYRVISDDSFVTIFYSAPPNRRILTWLQNVILLEWEAVHLVKL